MPLLENLQQFDVMPSEFFLLLGLLCLLLFLQAASLGAPLLAAAAEGLFAARRKAFYDKCALQISQLACLLGVAGFAVSGVFLCIGLQNLQPDFPRQLPPLPLWLPGLAAPLLSGLHLALRGPLKTRRVFRVPLCLAAAAAAFAMQLACLLLLDILQDPPLTVPQPQNELFDGVWEAPLAVLAARLLSHADSPAFWPALVCPPVFGLAAAAALSQLWLIVRRGRADYGRDYYSFAMRYCARAALAATAAALTLAGGIFALLRTDFPGDFSQPPDLGLALVAAGLPLSCCLIWLGIIKSDHPLRHKPGVLFACLFLLIALYACLPLFGGSFPTP
jgi:hypothetical protein